MYFNSKYTYLYIVINEWFDGKTMYTKKYEHNYRIAKNLIEYLYKKYSPGILKIYFI